MLKHWIKFYCGIALALVLLSCSAPPSPGKPASLSELLSWSAGRPPIISAHRGGSYSGYPENCLETFDYVLHQYPVMVECDVARTADGKLILMHDETLDRTTNGAGKVEDHQWDELENLYLKDHRGKLTNYQIPTLREALSWARDGTVLMVDIKRSVSFKQVVNLIEQESAEDRVILITYTLDAAKRLHDMNPDLMLSLQIRNQQELERFLQSDIAVDRMIAFVGTSEPPLELYDKLHQYGISCILGTLGNLDRRATARGDRIYGEFVERGADVLATDRPLEAGAELSKTWQLSVPHSVELIEN